MGQDRRRRFNITDGGWGLSRGVWSVWRDLDLRRYGSFAFRPRIWQQIAGRVRRKLGPPEIGRRLNPTHPPTDHPSPNPRPPRFCAIIPWGGVGICAGRLFLYMARVSRLLFRAWCLRMVGAFRAGACCDLIPPPPLQADSGVWMRRGTGGVGRSGRWSGVRACERERPRKNHPPVSHIPPDHTPGGSSVCGRRSKADRSPPASLLRLGS